MKFRIKWFSDYIKTYSEYVHNDDGRIFEADTYETAWNKLVEMEHNMPRYAYQIEDAQELEGGND